MKVLVCSDAEVRDALRSMDWVEEEITEADPGLAGLDASDIHVEVSDEGEEPTQEEDVKKPLSESKKRKREKLEKAKLKRKKRSARSVPAAARKLSRLPRRFEGNGACPNVRKVTLRRFSIRRYRNE